MTTQPTIEVLGEPHLPALRKFFDRLPEGDVTYIKEDVRDPDTVASWVRPGTARRWVAMGSDGAVWALVALIPQTGWSNHVGELRLVVDAERRREGLGRQLARHALMEAVSQKLTKVYVEVVSDASAAVAMFQRLGFDPEALLVDHIRDRSGTLRDLMVLSHHTEGTWSSMATAGIDEEVGDGAAGR